MPLLNFADPQAGGRAGRATVNCAPPSDPSGAFRLRRATVRGGDRGDDREPETAAFAMALCAVAGAPEAIECVLTLRGIEAGAAIDDVDARPPLVLRRPAPRPAYRRRCGPARS